MTSLKKSLILLILVQLTVSSLVLTLLKNNYRSVSSLMDSDIHELYQHTIKLKMDNDLFFRELQNFFHHPEELYSREMRKALDLMTLRLNHLESTAAGLPENEELMSLYPPIKKQQEGLIRLIEDASITELMARYPEIERRYEEYSEGSWNLILSTDRHVKGTIEASTAIFRQHELIILIVSGILILLVFALVVLLFMHKKNILKLKINEQKLQVVLDSIHSVVLSIDSDLRISAHNRPAEEKSAIDGTIIGLDLYMAFPDLPLEREELVNSISQGIPLEKEQKSGLSGEEQNEVRIYPLSDGDSPGAVIVIADRSEQSRMKDLIARNEKMLSVGGLAAGMAHEINNPLAGMIQTAAVIRNRLEDRTLKGNIRAAEECGLDMERLADYMEKRHIGSLFNGMAASGEQASAIVGNMLDFVQRDNTAVSSHDMITVIERALELAATDYDMKSYLYIDRIEMIKEFETGLPLVPCSGSRIQQVILNILKNGAEAMVVPRRGPPEGSHFIIRLKRIDSAVRIEIEDNGPGMEESVRKRIFDPFYTTKGIGQGTGLGLSVAYFIISENHKGRFLVESAPGKGTNFIIELPLAEDNN